MKRSNTYLYELDGNLYINLTSRCSNCCNFCVRNGKDEYFGHQLWLEKEPTKEDIFDGLAKLDLAQYKTFAFCGFGEPTYRMDLISCVGKYLKSLGKIVRINTNGQGSLINGRDICFELKDAVTSVNVSLNESEATKYQEVCHSLYGEKAFFELLDFAKKCQEIGVDTVLSVVDSIGEKDVAKCQKLADEIGCKLKVRTYID